jgi:hypothetical protein
LTFIASLAIGAAGVACRAAEPVLRPSERSGVAGPEAPVPPPRPGITGCVESPSLKAYVQRLDAHRKQARQAALSALGASSEERQGVWAQPGAPKRLGDTFEVGGKRFAVAAQLASELEPRVSLASQAGALRRIEERPRAHAVRIVGCGTQRCSRRSPPAPVTVRPLAIELAPGERWGEPLGLSYDFWWADVRHATVEACAPEAAAR